MFDFECIEKFIDIGDLGAKFIRGLGAICLVFRELLGSKCLTGDIESSCDMGWLLIAYEIDNH